MYSKEFFVQRSFEVVWAVFRVAEHVVRPKIKDGLEDKAMNYLLGKDAGALDELEEIVRFCAQIKEISAVNANVLLREIGNLRAAMMEIVDNQRRQLAPVKNPETAPRIEEVFSRPPMKVSDLIEAIIEARDKEKGGMEGSNDVKDIKFKENKEEPKNKESGGFDKPLGRELGAERLTTSNSPAREENSPAREEKSAYGRQESGKNPAREDKSPARPSFAEVSEGKTKRDRFEAVIGFKDRNEIIMNILTKRTLCHLKDLITALPNVSERTIRYDIQRLMDKGAVERVGTGGPNSFFRLIKEQVENKPPLRQGFEGQAKAV